MNNKTHRIVSVILTIIIIMLLILLFRECDHKPNAGYILGPPGHEYFNEDPPKEEKKGGTIGASIPASVAVNNGEIVLPIKNIGEESIVPFTVVDGKEVYRSSKVLASDDKVTAIISVGNTAEECITYIETIDGEVFSITTKFAR